jgi:hypothetical protein
MACKVTGANAKLALKIETAYGAKAAGNYLLVPFLSFDLAAKDGRSDDPVLGYGRDAQRPARDVVDVTGNIVVPVDTVAIGWWLALLFGSPATTGASAPYTHVFKSGAASLPSFTLEVQHTDAGLYYTYTGVMAQSLAIDFSPSGRARATIGLIAKSEELDTTSDAGTPTTPTLKWFDHKVNSIQRDGADLAKAMRFSLSYANNLDIDRFVGGNGEIGCVAPGLAAATGSLTARYTDATLHGLAAAGTILDLKAGWSNGAAESLMFELEQAELFRSGRSINGPGGIEQGYDVVGSKDFGEGQMLKATLVNATAAYA